MNEQLVRALIVDDEALSRGRIRRMLQKHPGIELAGECANGPDAVSMIRKVKPDLLFLDVQMPGMDGFQVLEKLKEEEFPFVVFVTAFNQYAIKAFEVYALDYLLKPFNEERFAKTLARARAKIAEKRSRSLNDGLLALLKEVRSRSNYLDRIPIKEEGRVSFVRVEDIDWIQAESKYLNIHAGKQSHLIRETLSMLEGRLNPRVFYRIHRSTIVNIGRVKELQPWFYGEYRVVLQNGTVLNLSRSYRKKFMEALGNL